MNTNNNTLIDTPITNENIFIEANEVGEFKWVPATVSAQLERKCSELQRENAEMRADMERLDWLDADPYFRTHKINSRYALAPKNSPQAMIRAAIDEARKEKP